MPEVDLAGGLNPRPSPCFPVCGRQGAKMFKYLQLQMLCDVTFAVFVLIWIVTRLGIYPGWILYR